MEWTSSLFGDLLPWVFGFGILFVACGTAARYFISNGRLRDLLGRDLMLLGLAMVLGSIAFYLIMEVIGSAFDELLSNLPGS